MGKIICPYCKREYRVNETEWSLRVDSWRLGDLDAFHCGCDTGGVPLRTIEKISEENLERYAKAFHPHDFVLILFFPPYLLWKLYRRFFT